MPTSLYLMPTSLYQQRPPQSLGVDVARTHVLDLTTFVDELRDISDRGLDVYDRNSSDTDAGLRAQIELLVHFAQKYIFGDEAAFEDPETIGRLRDMIELARHAVAFLKSSAPEVQRALRKPSPHDLEFILTRIRTPRRRNARYCNFAGRRSPVLRFLRVPGTKLDMIYVIQSCATFEQATRILDAIKLDYSVERGGKVLLAHGEPIVRGAA